MIKTIIQKEMLDNMLSLRFMITLVLCLVLIPLSIFVSARQYEKSLQDYNQSVSLYRESMHGMRNAVDVEVRGIRPPSPFSIFAGGLEKTLPNEFVSTRDSGLLMENNRTIDDPLSALFGKMDFLFLVGIVLSLMAILFTFDAVTREAERGTLRLAVSNSLPRHHILIGKYAGHFFTFLIPYAASLLIGILVLSVSGIVNLFQGEYLVRLLVIIAASLLYISVFFNLGLLVSTLTRRSLTAQISLLFIWVLLIFVLPRASHIAARIVHPVKTQQTVNLEKALVRKNIEDEKAAALNQEFSRNLNDNTNEGALKYEEIRAPIVARLKQKENEQLASIEREYRLNKNRQLRLASGISRISPLASFTFALTELSNTGIIQMDNIFEQAGQFHETINREVHSQGYKDNIPGLGMRMRMGWINTESIPKFYMQNPRLSQTMQKVWIDIFLLFFFNILFFAAAYMFFIRYDVR